MSGIKRSLKTLVSLMMIFAMILTSVPSMADEAHDFSGTFQVIAGQNEEIGSASVTVDNGMLTLHITMDPNWPADEYHLYILEDEPTDRLNPGHAPYSSDDLGHVTEFTIGPLDLNLPEIPSGQCLTRYLVLHLVSGNETAYTGEIIDPAKGPWYGFIEITICNPKTTPTGSITLQKIVVDSNDDILEKDNTSFTINVTNENHHTTAVEITGNATAPALTDLPLGKYTISEVAPKGYTLLNIESGTLTATNDLQITISEDDLIHQVTVTNQKDASAEPDPWSLHLAKVVVGSQGQTLTSDQTTFAIHISGLTPAKISDYDHTIQIVGSTTAPAIQISDPGDYQISETVPNGYTLKSIQLGDTFLTDGVITLSESNRGIPIEVTVTNQKEEAPAYTAALKLIKKVVDTENNQKITSDTFDITIKYPDGTLNTETLKGDGTPVTLTGLKPGPYTITETAPAGYTLKSIQSGDMTTDSALTITLSGSNPETPTNVTVTNEHHPEPDPDPDPEPEPPDDTNPPSDSDPPTSPPDKRGEIRVHKFLDTNQNNHQESSEFDMQKITFELYAADKTTLLSTRKSDSDGNLTFTNLKYGTYYLREVSDYTITSPAFSADGFTTAPITINSTTALTFNVGNFRDTSTEDVPPGSAPPSGPPDEPPDTEIVEEEPPPLGAPPWEPPSELPPTGEIPAAMLNLLGTLLLLAGAFLKYQY